MRSKMAIRLAVPALLLFALGGSARGYAQDRDDYYRYNRGYERVNTIIDRVQYDLSHTDAYFSRGDQRRVSLAQGELSDFQREWAAGRFDREELNDAIAAIQNVVDRNALGYRDRGVLLGDLSRLRQIRESSYGPER